MAENCCVFFFLLKLYIYVLTASPKSMSFVACVAAGDCRDGCCRQLLRNQQRHAQSTCSRLYWDGLIVGLEFRPSSGP